MIPRPRRLLALAGSLALVAAFPAYAAPRCSALSPAVAPQEEAPSWQDQVQTGPGEPPADAFHPDREPMPAPRKGGRVIVHVLGLPKHMNYMTENSATTRRMNYELHDWLVQRDWSTWEYEGRLAKDWIVEDTLVLEGGRGEGLHENVVFGAVEDEGDHYVVTPLSPGHPLTEPVEIPKDEVAEHLRKTVYTFQLREGVTWQDGHPFDAGDVLFSYESYRNPHVDCDSVRYQYEKLAGAEAIGDHAIRFLFEKQYFLNMEAFDKLFILPSHVYDLHDPDNDGHYDPRATDARQGAFINEHPNNHEWMGLGPYRLTEYTNQYVEAERWDGYWDPSDGGYVDQIRWRHIPSDEAAKQAVINGDIDYWDRLRPEDYFGEFTQQKAFTEQFYKGIAIRPAFNYVTWNMRRSKLADVRVRRALAHCIDVEDYMRTVEYGLAWQVTGSAYRFSPWYDENVEPIPFDLDAAQDLLIEAGWYDRDGDDIIDKDGEPFVIEYLMQASNTAATVFAQKLQENLGKIGIKMSISTREWATLLERIYERDFDAASLAWVVNPQDDPEQLWHSRHAPEGIRSSNHPGFADPRADELIEAIQVELDPDEQIRLFHELHARIYSQQPYLFQTMPAKKFVASKRIRNLKCYVIDPGYRIREWYLVDEGEAREAVAREDSEGSDG